MHIHQLLIALLAPLATAAAVLRWESCCFQLTASGGASGVLTQLSGGQIRIGGGMHPATYCIKNGIITDDSPHHRVCILSDDMWPTGARTQFVCDSDPNHDNNFAVTADFLLEHEGQTTFHACPAGPGQWNLFSNPLIGMVKCVPVTLNTNGRCSTV